MTAPTLRDLDPSEAPWVARWERRIFGPAAWSLAAITAEFGWRRFRGIVADGELVGYAVYGFDGDAFSLMNLAVLPQARRRGAASAAMRDLLDEARRLDAAEVWLEVAHDNAGAIALYRAHGFEDVRVRRNYYQPGDVDALVMRSVVAPPDARTQ